MKRPEGARRPPEEPAGVRPLRADAQMNHDRLLEVAARHFAEAGPDASMKAIAREAGVGIGTLYRRFPTREILVEATYRSESGRLCEAAPALLREMPPGDALREWMRMFLGYMAAKRGMAGALRVLLTADDGLRLQTRGMLIESLAVLLRAGAEAGTIRAGADATDVVMALGGFASIIGEQQVPGLTGRLLDLLLHGLAAPGLAAPGPAAPGPAARGAAAATAGLSGAAAGPFSPGDRGKVHITDK